MNRISKNITGTIPLNTFHTLRRVIKEKLGLHYSADQKHELEYALYQTLPGFGIDSLKLLAERLSEHPLNEHDIAILARHLTINETYFFREPGIFDYIASTLRTSRSDRSLTIWSAGCSSGEEPYSIAMFLRDNLPDFQSWNISIIATDIDELALQKALQGEYTDWSFRNTNNYIKGKYFKRLKNNTFLLEESIRRMVRFSNVNLAGTLPAFTDGLDIVFCRNVLMYFDEELRSRLFEYFFSVIKPGGLLVLSLSEVSLIDHPGFRREYADNMMLFVRRHSKTEAKKPDVQNPDLQKPDLQKPEAKRPEARRPGAAKPDRPSKSDGPGYNSLGISEKSGFIRKTDSAGSYSEASVQAALAAAGGKRPAPSGGVSSNAGIKNAGIKNAGKEQKSIENRLSEMFEQSAYQEVISLARKTLSDNESFSGKEKVQIYLLLARAYANTGNLSQARYWCSSGIAELKIVPELYSLLATVLIEENEHEEAAKNLQHAIFLQPENVTYHFTLGNLLRRTGRSAESAREFAFTLTLLENLDQSSIIEDTGLTAGRLREIIKTMKF